METAPKISFDNTAVAFKYKSDKALRKANFIFSLVNHPWISSLATGLVKFSFLLRLPVDPIIKKTVFEHFCGGESIADSEVVITQLANYGVQTILDYSAEGEKTEAGFDHAVEETLRTIEKARGESHIPFSVFKVSGIASVELLEKVQQKTTLTSAEAEAYNRIRLRVNKICERAYESGVPVLIDAEESWIQEPIDVMAYEMMRLYNREKVIVFNTFQLYRTVSLKNLKEACHTAAMNNFHVGAKLVRGAYMEKERERAERFGYQSRIHPHKDATDHAFNEALLYCLENKQRVSMMCGSHNEYSNNFLTVMMEKHGMANNDQRIWFAQLYGMSDNISFNLAQAGYNVAKYVPYGPVKKVMPYLLRRAEENTSVAGQSSRELTLIRKELKRRKESEKL